MLRKRKAGPRKATAPLSQKAAQLQEEGGSLLDDSAKAAVARVRSESQQGRRQDRTPATSAPEAQGRAQAPAAKEKPQPEREQEAAVSGSDGAAPAPDDGTVPAQARQPFAQGALDDTPAGRMGTPERDAAAKAPDPTAQDAALPDAFAGQGSSGAPDAASEAPAPDVADGDAPRKGRPRRASKAKSENHGKLRAALIAILSVVVILIVCIAALSWNRWLRYDDAVDLQGRWIVVGGTDAITIDEGSIHLTDQDAYGYSLDTMAKTVSFSYGDLSGDARYRFSSDRTRVALQDGVYGPVGDFFDDLAWTLADVGSSIMGNGATSPSFGDGSVVLVREDALTDEERQAIEQLKLDRMSPEERAAAEEEAQRLAEEEAAAAEAQEAAEEEQRQQQLDIEGALEESGSVGEVGANAVRPEDVR